MGNNILRIEVAGSGKTYGICKDIISNGRPDSGKRVLVVTYTNNGCLSLQKEYKLQNGGVIDDYVDIVTWYHFVLAHLVKPYQTYFPNVGINEITSIDFSDTEAKRYSNRTKLGNHKSDKKVHLNSSSMIVKDFVSEFAKILIDSSNGQVITRLENIYDYAFFDEVQDLAGYDLDIIKDLCASKIHVTLVGDPLQATFATNTNTRKNKNCSGANIEKLSDICDIQCEKKTTSRRCNEAICKFAMHISHPSYTIHAANTDTVEHSGVFLIKESDAEEYFNFVKPQCLTWDKRSKPRFGAAINFGASKGMTFDHTLLVGTKKLTEFILKGGSLDAPEKYYVAATRAKFSVCIVVPKFPDNSSSIEQFETNSRTISLYRVY